MGTWGAAMPLVCSLLTGGFRLSHFRQGARFSRQTDRQTECSGGETGFLKSKRNLGEPGMPWPVALSG